MAIVSVRIPQMGEGLQEARLIEFLKKPGDRVRRDEPIYVMETDKAITEVECPFAGSIVEWLVEPDTVLPIGAEVGRMDVEEPVASRGHASHGVGQGHVLATAETAEAPLRGEPAASGKLGSNGGTGRDAGRRSAIRGNSGVPIPPRTRKYLREKGLSDLAGSIPAEGKKLLPEDVDRYLNSLAAAELPESPEPPTAGLAPSRTISLAAADFDERPLPKAQQTLNYRMQRGAEACIPAVLEIEIDWSHLLKAREVSRATSNATPFTMLVWCIVQAMRKYPALRSSLSSDGKTLRTYRHIHIGVAVAVEDGLLRTAVVRDADRLNYESFVASLQSQVALVRQGADQIDASTTVTVSNIGVSGVRMGIPVLVTPAVATIALGKVRQCPFPIDGSGFQFRPVASLTMTFDHRILNGVTAAEFLNEVRRLVESFELQPGT